MTVFQAIVELLEKNGVIYKLIEHAPVKTCNEAALIRGTSLDQGAKALVVWADKRAILVVLPCSRRLDIKEFKRKMGIKDLNFASFEEVFSLTGLRVGAIPPWGSLLNLPTYADSALASQDLIAFNAGEQSRSIVVAYNDYYRLEKPKMDDFSTKK